MKKYILVIVVCLTVMSIGFLTEIDKLKIGSLIALFCGLGACLGIDIREKALSKTHGLAIVLSILGFTILAFGLFLYEGKYLIGSIVINIILGSIIIKKNLKGKDTL